MTRVSVLVPTKTSARMYCREYWHHGYCLILRLRVVIHIICNANFLFVPFLAPAIKTLSLGQQYTSTLRSFCHALSRGCSAEDARKCEEGLWKVCISRVQAAVLSCSSQAKRCKFRSPRSEDVRGLDGAQLPHSELVRCVFLPAVR